MSDPTKWLRRSGVEIAAAIRRGETTSRAVVEAHIARIERVNPVINALVRDRFEQARDEADEADRRLREAGAGALPPFHGVPCTVKECFAMTGMPQTSGLVSRRDVVADHDAPTVT
ncbi:MAG: amidase family protein, partial [Polyangiales bacterium]